ncbi:MAG: hypothetical protein U0Q12_11735 [Vicinamibacterales bacterium]
MMRLFSLTSAVLPLLLSATPWSPRVEETDTTKRTLSFAGATDRRLEVDNVSGSIHVVGVAGLASAELVAKRTVKADSRERADAAKKEVTLEIKEGATVSVYVDGPFRRERHRSWWSDDDRGYEVRYDLELRVPVETSVAARTVNDGQVLVEEVSGRFDASNVNGKVTLTGMGGAGRAVTVNGGVDVQFRRVPSGECQFKTVNGDVVVRVPADFAADLTVKTLNGEVYSDFDVTTRPRDAVTDTRRGRRIVRAGNAMALRVGSGGPAMSFETLNGDIQIRRP